MGKVSKWKSSDIARNPAYLVLLAKKVVVVQQDSMVMFIVLRCVVDKCDWSASRDFFLFSIYLPSTLS